MIGEVCTKFGCPKAGEKLESEGRCYEEMVLGGGKEMYD